jgi:hypothetical protein
LHEIISDYDLQKAGFDTLSGASWIVASTRRTLSLRLDGGGKLR